MSKDLDREQLVKQQVEADFLALDAAASALSPGLLDIMEVYGQYEIAVRQANVYLGLLSPTPAATTAASSAPSK
jgi:hypothetical protein